MINPWTTRDIPDQTGKRAIVTGANSGIGWHTAMELARAGAEVTIASRDAGKAAARRARVLVAARWCFAPRSPIKGARG